MEGSLIRLIITISAILKPSISILRFSEIVILKSIGLSGWWNGDFQMIVGCWNGEVVGDNDDDNMKRCLEDSHHQNHKAPMGPRLSWAAIHLHHPILLTSDMLMVVAHMGNISHSQRVLSVSLVSYFCIFWRLFWPRIGPRCIKIKYFLKIKYFAKHEIFR